MEILTLPGPAGELWAAKRDVIHSLPAEVFGQPIRPHIGGGTTLAARWKHRLSTDIDILLPGRNTLIDLLQDDERNVVRRLGGEPEAVTDCWPRSARHGPGSCRSRCTTAPTLRAQDRFGRRPSADGPDLVQISMVGPSTKPRARSPERSRPVDQS